MTEAPPPCEACRLSGDDPGVELLAHNHHVLSAAMDAEIAELRALLAEYIDWHDDELGVDTPAEGNEPYWLERVRAALAPKSSAGGGGD